VVEERHTQTRDRFQDLEDLLDALLDPVYRERWLRARKTQGPGHPRPALSGSARSDEGAEAPGRRRARPRSAAALQR